MTHSTDSQSIAEPPDDDGPREVTTGRGEAAGHIDVKLHPGDLLHFAGVGGSGMSALAQFHVWSGGRATGSDRAFDEGKHPEIRARLEAAGVRIVPQDGRGLTREHRALVVSTAVEETVPDVRAARELATAILHRSELLALWVRSHRTLAVTGTSGKSTVVAMIFEILQAAGRNPGVITGGNLRSLQSRGLLGNAACGSGDLLVIEADESDGSLVRYEPAVGVVLNLQRDHKEPEVVFEMFETFCDQTREALVLGEGANLDALAEGPDAAEEASGRTTSRMTSRPDRLEIVRYGLSEDVTWRATEVELAPTHSRFRVFPPNVTVTLPTPGAHNVENALAAMAAVHAVGVDGDASARGLAGFEGVARRFQEIGTTAGGVQVIDDFAHNPAKIVASLRTAHLRAKRVLAIFQAHGFGPTRFIRNDLVAELSKEMGTQDEIWFPEIYYAGGTVTRDLSAADLVDDLRQRGVSAHFEAKRDGIVSKVAEASAPGDLVLVMGARDPSLTGFARALFAAIEEKEQRLT